MADDRLEEMTALLVQAGEAHGTYEIDVLHGVYDQDWALWYAGYVVEQGISALIGHVVTVNQMAQFFTTTFADYQAAQPGESWAAYTARRIRADL